MNTVKTRRIGMTALLLGVLLLPLSGCLTKSGPAASNQFAPVQRGNLTIDITGAGNLSLSQTQDLAFEVAGYVQEVLVKEGESVKKDQVVAKLGTSEWDKQVKNLEKALATAQRTLTTRQRALERAERQVASKDLAVRSADLDVQSAENNLKDIVDIKRVQDDIDQAQKDLDTAVAVLHGGMAGAMSNVTYWDSVRSDAVARLAQLNKNLQSILSGTNANVSSDVALQVSRSQLQLEQTQRQLEEAKIAVEDADLAVEDARLDVTDAEENVADAQSDLDEASRLSPIIKAPFDGIINKVNVKGGDEIFKGAVAVQLADPTKFTADIVVGESDIIKVKEGGAATIRMDALPGLTLQARVSHISPSASIQSGVVSYKVTVEMETLRASGSPAESFTPAELDTQPSLSPAPSPGSAQFRSGQSGQRVASPARSLSLGVSSTQTEQIRAGMSVTVSIAVAESRNVLMVPNQAITYNGRTAQVQVSQAGVTETRTVRTGINNWQYTEILEGLNEGEQVVITASLGTTPTSSNPARSSSPSNQRGGQQAPIVIPGAGGR